MSPQRIQRQRVRGWRMPPGVTYVGRPTVWGNAWTARDYTGMGYTPTEVHDWLARKFDAEWETILLSDNNLRDRPVGRKYGPDVPVIDIIRAELGGRDLACWCPADRACHADTLLRLAAS